MDHPRISDIDERLNELAKKRDIVEKRIQFREKTLAEFSVAHEQSVARSLEMMEKQNQQARLRNLQLLREVGAAAGYQHDRRLLGANTRTCEQLNRAKESYLSFTEKLLPTWKDHQSLQREGILRKLQREKQDAEQRREITLREMHRGRQLEIAVEEERRKLVLALTLEERDRLEAEAHSAMLREQGRAMDHVLQREFAEFGEEYQKHIENSTVRSALDAKHVLSPMFQIPVSASTVTPLQYPQGEKQLHMPGRTKDIPRDPRLTVQNTDGDDGLMSPPQSRSSYTNTLLTEPTQISHTSRLEISSSGPAATATGDATTSIAAATALIAPDGSAEEYKHSRPSSIVESTSFRAGQTAVADGIGASDKGDGSSSGPEPLPFAPTKPAGEAAVVGGPDNDDIKSPAPAVSEMSKKEHEARTREMLKVNPTMKSAALPPKPPVRKSHKDTHDKVTKMDFEPAKEPVSEPAQDTHLTANMEGNKVAAVLHAVCRYLEDLEEPLAVKQAYAAASGRSATMAESSGRVPLIIHRLSAGVEDVAAVLRGSGIAVEELTSIVLRIAIEQGSALLPSEALNGVITAEKIMKIHKKLGGCRQDMWQELVQHMQILIERKRMSQEEICKYFSDALIKHVDENDRERTQRKVMKAVQLAVLPLEKESTPRSSPAPPRSRVPIGPLDPAPTPTSTSLAESYPFSPPGTKVSPITPAPAAMLSSVAQSITQQGEPSRTVGSASGSSPASRGIDRVSKKTPSKPTMSSRILQGLQIDDDEIEDDEVIDAPRVVFTDISANAAAPGDDDEFDFNIL